MLSNWATLTNIRTSSRSAWRSLCHFWKLDSRVSHLIRLSAQPDNMFQQTVIGTMTDSNSQRREDSYD